MIRRNARLRREYLYRKNLEGEDRAKYEKKRRVKEALADGKRVPTELRGEADKLRHEAEFDDNNTERMKSASQIDDEYARAGIVDPKIFLTSSRDPSSRLQQFMKELRVLIPNSHLINRGATVIKELVEIGRKDDFTDIILVQEHRGQPDGLMVCHLPYGPTAYFSLSNVVLRHDLPEKLPNMSEAYPHLIFHKLESKLGERIKTILKYLFPVPKPDTRRVITFANRTDVISFRHHSYKKKGKEIELGEIGPRFEMKPYQIKLGTIDMAEAQNEWVHRPYMNTAAKRIVL